MNKQIDFRIDDKTRLNERVIEYFVKSGFKCSEIKNDKLEFTLSSSLLNTWTTNPLKWGSKITITINENELRAVFCIDTDGQMNSIEEENIWNAFIDNFRTFVDSKSDTTIFLKKITATVKKSRLIYIGWTIFGVAVGGITGSLFSYLTGSKMIGYFIVPIVATLFLNKSLQDRREKITVS